MWVTVNGNNATEIEDVVIHQILGIFPEEKLIDRPKFTRAFNEGSIKLIDLKEECRSIMIPWQLFLLSKDNLDIQIHHIEKQRSYKVSRKLLAKRNGLGNVTSKRIIDRLIRQQDFLTENNDFPINTYCGSLKNKSAISAAKKILSHFDINQEKYWNYSASKRALEYFIQKIEIKNINISRGVLANQLLPNHQVVGNSIYKNTSGFVIKDECIPFIFLPSEVNPDEVDSRQLYTLSYLLAVIGLNQFDYVLATDFKGKMLNNRVTTRLHLIASELLIPSSEVEQYRASKFTDDLRDDLCKKFKVTPTALLTTLKIRKIITESEYEELKPPQFQPTTAKKSNMNPPKVSTSIRKFCGEHVYQSICFGINSKTLPNTQAQYLIYGAINKKGFHKFRTEIKL